MRIQVAVNFLLLLFLYCSNNARHAFVMSSSARPSSVSQFDLSATSAAAESTTTCVFTEQELFDITKDFIATKQGLYSEPDGSAYAEDFVFRGGVIGPLNKKDYVSTMMKLNVYDAFDLVPNAFGFTIDPDDPYILPIVVEPGADPGNIAEQEAYWVSEDTIAWDSGGESSMEEFYPICEDDRC